MCSGPPQCRCNGKHLSFFSFSRSLFTMLVLHFVCGVVECVGAVVIFNVLLFAKLTPRFEGRHGVYPQEHAQPPFYLFFPFTLVLFPFLLTCSCLTFLCECNFSFFGLKNIVHDLWLLHLYHCVLLVVASHMWSVIWGKKSRRSVFGRVRGESSLCFLLAFEFRKDSTLYWCKFDAIHVLLL